MPQAKQLILGALDLSPYLHVYKDRRPRLLIPEAVLEELRVIHCYEDTMSLYLEGIFLNVYILLFEERMTLTLIPSSLWRNDIVFKLVLVKEGQ